MQDYLYLEAKNINFKDGAALSTSTNGGGQGGKITVKAVESILLDGRGTKDSTYFASGTYHDSDNSGDAGSISIEAKNIFLSDGGYLFSSTEGKGNSGYITLNALQGITISGQGIGLPARITVESKYHNNAGDAGSIVIKAEELNLIDRGTISSLALNAGGGDIAINSSKLIHLQTGQIITSVKGGIGDGGNIDINNPVHVTLNGSSIKAQADAGHGGNITIIADNVTLSQQSIIDASSRKGVDGKILISSPSGDISGELLALSSEFKDMSNQLKTPCSSRKEAFM